MISNTDHHTGFFFLSFLFSFSFSSVSVLLLQIAASCDVCSPVPVHIALERIMILLAVVDRSAAELAGHWVRHLSHLVAFSCLW